MQVQLPMAVAEPEFVAQLSLLAAGAPLHSLHDSPTKRPPKHIWDDFSWHRCIELAWPEQERLCRTAAAGLKTRSSTRVHHHHRSCHSAAAPLLLQCCPAFAPALAIDAPAPGSVFQLAYPRLQVSPQAPSFETTLLSQSPHHCRRPRRRRRRRHPRRCARPAHSQLQ